MNNAPVSEVSGCTPSCQPVSHRSAPTELLMVIERSVRGMDQKLGYPGRERFVFFYYEARGEEVVWRDSHSYAFATGAWQVFLDELAPLAKLYGVDLGSNGQPVKHVLLIDRGNVKAYFVPKHEAIEFMARVGAGEHVELPDAIGGKERALQRAASVEITQETIAGVAYEIWQRKGRPEGETLQDWLEAEAQFRVRESRTAAGQPT